MLHGMPMLIPGTTFSTIKATSSWVPGALYLESLGFCCGWRQLAGAVQVDPVRHLKLSLIEDPTEDVDGCLTHRTG